MGLPISRPPQGSEPGVYLLVEANGHMLPAVAYLDKTDDRTCKSETLGRAMLLETIGGTYQATLDKDVLRVQVIGIGSFEGQTAEFVWHKVE